MKTVNEMKMTIDSKSVNEGFSRVAIGAFVASLDPDIEELSDIKAAVSEAVTNAIIHGYREKTGKIYITVSIFENNTVRIRKSPDAPNTVALTFFGSSLKIAMAEKLFC